MTNADMFVCNTTYEGRSPAELARLVSARDAEISALRADVARLHLCLKDAHNLIDALMDELAEAGGD